MPLLLSSRINFPSRTKSQTQVCSNKHRARPVLLIPPGVASEDTTRGPLSNIKSQLEKDTKDRQRDGCRLKVLLTASAKGQRANFSFPRPQTRGRLAEEPRHHSKAASWRSNVLGDIACSPSDLLARQALANPCFACSSYRLCADCDKCSPTPVILISFLRQAQMRNSQTMN